MNDSTMFTSGRIQEAMSKARSFWLGESSEPMVSVYTQPTYRQNPDPDVLVEEACRCIRADAASGREEILPCFWPDFGTVSTAAMWGGEIIPPEGNRCIHIHPVAKSIADLASLQAGPFEQSDFQRGLDLYQRVCERMETDAIFIRTPDFQGPMNTLALLVDQTDLLCALYEEPDLIHSMLDRVTDVLIATIQRFCREAGPANVIGNIWPYVTLPADMGICITQDYMPLLGPEFYAEFEIPRLKRIADAFGGVFIHCCGEYARHLPALKNGGFKIWGLEAAYPQTPVWEIHEVFGDEIAYLVGVSPDGEAVFPTIVDYAREIASRPCASARFWFAAAPDSCDTAALRSIVKAGFGFRIP